MTTYAHPLVLETAREMAGAMYEELAKNDLWYQLNPDQLVFIEKAAPELLDQARQALAATLGPGSTLPEDQKAVVAEALLQDHTIAPGRNRPTIGLLN